MVRDNWTRNPSGYRGEHPLFFVPATHAGVPTDRLYPLGEPNQAMGHQPNPDDGKRPAQFNDSSGIGLVVPLKLCLSSDILRGTTKILHFNNRINDLAVSDSGFIFDPNTGSTFSATSVGCHILTLLKQDLKFNEILTSIQMEYDVGEADLHHHFQEFIASLVEFGLLSRDDADRATACP